MTIPTSFSLAQSSYKLLEPIKGFTGETVTNPGKYIQAIYWYALGFAVLSAILMIVIGGVEYTTSWASDSNKGKAKERITNAIIGLVIALTGYLILNTVNPNLVKMDLSASDANCETATTPGTSNPQPTPGAPAGGGSTGAF